MSKQNPETFQIGDTVIWTSQANGNAKTKTGKILFIVPSAQSACKNGTLGEYKGFTVTHLTGIRNHESYLIQVGKSKRLYWPLVKYLKRADP